MTPEQKFRAVEAKALGHLSHPLGALDPLTLSHASVVALIWTYPSFEPSRSWSLIRGKDAKPDTWLVRRVTWDRPRDYERASNPLERTAFMMDPDPKPTLQVLDASAGSEFAERFLARLGTLTIPSLLASYGGVDGVVNGLETQHGRLHVEWWCEGPPNWRTFAGEVERLRIQLDSIAESAIES